MNLGAALKTRRGRFILIVVVLGMVVLCGVGVFGGEEMPVISLAAENIPLPFRLPVFGNHIPNTLPSTWLTMIILIVIALAYNRTLRKAGPPSRLRVAVEAVGQVMLDFMENAVGENARVFFPLVATFFVFIAVNNWCGILPGFGSIGVRVPHHVEAVSEEHHEEEAAAEHGEEHEGELVPFFRSADAHLSTTLALAIISVVAAQYFGFKMQGAAYLNKYLNFRASSPKPDPASQKGLEKVVSKVARTLEIVVNGIVGLLEIILEALKVLPFSFRLFGNIFAGEVLLFVVSFLFAFVFPIIFLGLELFVGLIQGLIFAMLTLVFFSIATTSHHGEEH
jgi:F-type H+-transporting ATPase subunit a